MNKCFLAGILLIVFLYHQRKVMEGLTIEEVNNSNANSNANSNTNSNANSSSNQLCLIDDEKEHAMIDYIHPDPTKDIKGKCSQKLIDDFREIVNDHAEDLSNCRRKSAKMIKKHRELHQDNIDEHQTYIKLYFDLFSTTYILVVLIALGLAYKYTTRVRVDGKFKHYFASIAFSPFYIMFYIFKTN